MARKQLIIDTSFDEPDVIQSPNRQNIPKYCLKQDFNLKIISIILLAAFYIVSATIN